MDAPKSRPRESSGSRIRSASISILSSSPPTGAWAAAGQVVAKAPSFNEIRAGEFTKAAQLLSENKLEPVRRSSARPNYRLPPEHTWGQATKIALVAFWKFLITPMGFLIVLYCLNIVAWGGMLFLLLCNAAPAMNHPSANDINSPRRKWIEWDSQILNALFCVTGLGLIPWRFRDLYLILRYRLGHYDALRKLAGFYRGWFRLPESDKLPLPVLEDYPPTELDPEKLKRKKQTYEDEDNPALPLPCSAAPDVPLTGVRAPPTRIWTLDFMIWCMVLNTAFQIVLCFFMWHYNRVTRPSWATGLFIALGAVSGGLGGLTGWWEGRRVKKVEGIAWGAADILIDAERASSAAV